MDNPHLQQAAKLVYREKISNVYEETSSEKDKHKYCPGCFAIRVPGITCSARLNITKNKNKRARQRAEAKRKNHLDYVKSRKNNFTPLKSPCRLSYTCKQCGDKSGVKLLIDPPKATAENAKDRLSQGKLAKERARKRKQATIGKPAQTNLSLKPSLSLGDFLI